MNKIVIIVFMMLSVLTSCSKKDIVEHNYNYEGENEFWIAEYNVSGADTFTEKNGKLECESYSENKLTVTYKKELSDLALIKHIEISYEGILESGKLTEDYSDSPPNKKTYTLNSSSNTTVRENEDDVIVVTINVDGDIQEIDLKYVQ